MSEEGKESFGDRVSARDSFVKKDEKAITSGTFTGFCPRGHEMKNIAYSDNKAICLACDTVVKIK